MLQQIIGKLPDDNPITAVGVIEDINKPPEGYYIVSKTYDLDSDADLGRGPSFFIGHVKRYLCLSKTEGIGDYIVDSIGIIGEKDSPPDGYCLISKTLDTDAKAWKKRQMCYSLTRRHLATTAVTDIIILAKGKKAPDGFQLAGNINGFAVSFKVNNVIPQSPKSVGPISGYNLSPSANFLSNNFIANGHAKNSPVSPLPRSPNVPDSPSDEYVNLLMPKRRAPPPPTPPSSSSPYPSPYSSPYPKEESQRIKPPQNVPGSYATFNLHQGLDGIPFVFHPTLQVLLDKSNATNFPKIKVKTREEIIEKYHYDFRLERECS